MEYITFRDISLSPEESRDIILNLLQRKEI